MHDGRRRPAEKWAAHDKGVTVMTHHEQQLRQAYRKSGLGLLRVTFERAMQDKAIRIALECAVKAQTKGKPEPVQPALI